jgi:acid phosphatase (class A)
MAAQAPSNSPPANGAETAHAVYLTGKEEAWLEFPKSPALGSERDQLDLLVTLSIQASRTPEQDKEALRDRVFSIKLLTDVIDPAFEAKYPRTFRVLDRADDDAYFITSMLKEANARPRPFAQHPILVRPLFTAGNFSYPSGHSSGSELQARILGQLFPAQADRLLKRARQIADSRVVAGVHYAIDTEAGLNLGDQLFQELEAKAQFREELAAAAAADKISRP